MPNSLLPKIQELWTLSMVSSFLKGVGLITHNPPEEVFLNVCLFGEPVDRRAPQLIRRTLRQIDQCQKAMEYVYGLYQEAGHDWPTYLRSRFGEMYLQRFRPDSARWQKLVDSRKRGCRFVRDLPESEGISLIDFNQLEDLPSIQSSDYWAEVKAGNIPPRCCSANAPFSQQRIYFRYDELAAYLPNCPMAKIIYPRFYEFLCGGIFRHVNRFRFKLVAIRNETSPEALLEIARHFVEHYYMGNMGCVTVEHLLESVRVYDITYYTENVLEKGEIDEDDGEFDFSDFDGPTYFKEDYDDDKGNITFVEFTCSVESYAQLNCKTFYTHDLEKYRKGEVLQDYSSGLFQQVRDLFDHPMELCLENRILGTIPRLEDLGDFMLDRHYNHHWELLDVVGELIDFGTEEQRKLLKPLCQSLLLRPVGNPRLRVISFSYNDIYNASVLDPQCYDMYMREVELWKEFLEELLKVRPLWRSAEKFSQVVAGIIEADPLSYVDSDVYDIEWYAHSLIT